jgi:hypothetical protein
MTVKELTDLLRIPAKTIYTWRYKRSGPPAIAIGKYLRLRPEDDGAWLDASAASAAPEGTLEAPGRRSRSESRLAPSRSAHSLHMHLWVVHLSEQVAVTLTGSGPAGEDRSRTED